MNLTNDHIRQAIALALIAHGNQTDKNGQIYLLHPLRVMNKCWRDGLTDPEYLITAVLHDVVEDTDITHEDVKDQYGGVVSSAVRLLTRDKDLDTYEGFIDKIVTWCRMGSESGRIALEVKKRDIRDNLDLRRMTDDATLFTRYARAYKRLMEEF